MGNMETVSDNHYATQRNPKACEACRQSKSRCLPSHQANICQRCVKFKFTCAVRAAARPKRSKKAAAIVVERLPPNPEPTEEENDTSGLYIKLPALPPVDRSESVAVLGEHHREAFSRIFSSDGKAALSDHCLDINLAVIDGADHATKTVEKIQRSLSIDEAEKLLSVFRTMAGLFPFVVIPESETVQSMSRNSPFLLLAILSSASFDDVQLHHGLDHEFKRILGSEVIAMGKKSLDFLQGVLVYTCWYPCHINPRNRQSFMFINVANSIAIELGLDKVRPGASLRLNDSIDTTGLLDGKEYSKAAKRAYMGCYYLSSSISLGFQKPNSLPYNSLIDDYGIFLATEPEFVNDFALLPLVRAYKLEEKVREFLKLEQRGITTSQMQSDAQLQIFRSELDDLRASTLNDVRSMVNFAIADRFIEITLYSYDLGLFRQETSSERFLNPRNLIRCLDACRTFFEYLLTLPITQYMMFTHVQWGCMVQAIVILSRLSFPISNCPGWDSRTARERAPLLMYLGCLCYSMQSLTSVPAGQVGVPKNPDAPYTFKAVLEFIIKKFNERLETLEKAAANGVPDMGHSCRGPHVRCPIRDPELAPLFQQDESSPESLEYGTSESGNSTGTHKPIYFDVWKTMTMGWGDIDFGA